MHFWGDEWFKEHGDDMYTAIDKIEDGLRRHGIGVCGKEKWGCYRDDFLRFWDGGIYYIVFGPSLSFTPKRYYRWKPFRKLVEFIHRAVWWLDHAVIPYKKTKYGWLKGGIATFNTWIGITKPVWDYQARMYNKVIQQVCAEYPDIVDELVSDLSGYKMIKPCKWGDVDGVEVHDRHWVPVSSFKEDEMNNETNNDT